MPWKKLCEDDDIDNFFVNIVKLGFIRLIVHDNILLPHPLDFIGGSNELAR